MKFVPLFDRVLIRPKDESRANSLGLVISDISKTKPSVGRVVAVASGISPNYNKCEMLCKVGDEVQFNPYSAVEVDIEGERLVVVRQIDIVGVYDEREDNC